MDQPPCPVLAAGVKSSTTLAHNRTRWNLSTSRKADLISHPAARASIETSTFSRAAVTRSTERRYEAPAFELFMLCNRWLHSQPKAQFLMGRNWMDDEHQQQFQQIAQFAGMSRSKATALEVGTFMDFAVAYRPNSSDEGVLSHSFENDIFLSGVPEYRPVATDIVLDIGAHLGDFSLFVSRKVNRVYAVEANGETYALLRANVSMNEANNIITDHAAIAGNNGYTELFHAVDGESWGDSTEFNYRNSSETVRSVTLDRYLFERNIPRVNFAKFNCEGAEFRIIMSTDAATLSKFDTMLILYHCDLVPEFNEQDLCRKFNQSGFKTTTRNQERERGWIIATRT